MKFLLEAPEDREEGPEVKKEVYVAGLLYTTIFIDPDEILQNA